MEKYQVVVKGIVKFQERYLIVQRWYDDRIEDPYQWGFVDGKIEFGESPDKAVVRLIREQTGLETMVDHIIYTWSYLVGDVHHIGISYECMTLTDEVFLSEELNDYRFVGKEEFEQYITNSKLYEDIARVFEI